jgi:hypothetical protein
MDPMQPSVKPWSTIRDIGPITTRVSDEIPQYNAEACVIGEPALSVIYVPIILILDKQVWISRFG